MTLLKRASWVAVVAVVGCIVALVTATPSAPIAAGTLPFRETMRMTSVDVPCPSLVPPEAHECRSRSMKADFRGLGRVSVTYVWSWGLGPPTCPSTLGKPLAAGGRIVVAGKGELYFTLAPGTRCVEADRAQNEPQDLTISGTRGVYEGASGSGKVGQRAIGGGVGSETWTGTLVAPKAEFDRTPPKLSGAKSKIVRAPRGARSVRVTYKVTASDNADRRVPVSGRPPSGSRFRIGRTVVRCSATDSSGNTASATFRVTVGPTWVVQPS